jgi:ferredoxin
MERNILATKRVCYYCGSDKTWHNKWLINWGTSYFLCTRCYSRLFLHPKYNGRRFKYKGVDRLGLNCRSGRCSWCTNNIYDGSCKETQWHHLKYDDNKPQAHRIELCASCHRKETIRLDPGMIPERDKNSGRFKRL